VGARQPRSVPPLTPTERLEPIGSQDSHDGMGHPMTITGLRRCRRQTWLPGWGGRNRPGRSLVMLLGFAPVSVTPWFRGRSMALLAGSLLGRETPARWIADRGGGRSEVLRLDVKGRLIPLARCQDLEKSAFDAVDG
jgi:hypothetical protein